MLKRLPVLIGMSQPHPTDLLLGSLGISAATLSAAFAGYMMLIGPHGGSGRSFPALAAVGNPITLAVSAPPHSMIVHQAAMPPLGAMATLPGDIDYTPTGSIGSRSRQDSPAADPTTRQAPAAGTAPRQVASVVIRDVFDGKALVEENNRLRLIEPGSVLESGSEVLAIRRQGNGWVVETSAGAIP